MVRVEGQEIKGSSKREFPPNSAGNDRGVERCESLCTNVESQREEIHGTGDKVQETSVSS